ncbi:MAG: hypothetical protein AMXMBFR37_13700 [Steroidobacteraceae bacterium]
MFTPELLKEAHAVLCTDPVMNGGVLDVGMNRRYHALVLAALFKANDAVTAPGRRDSRRQIRRMNTTTMATGADIDARPG